ncbi:MAG: carboxyl transferase, partial [Halieaceae bacterium]|nr:carboxyl transferase [Halieaceae bacterium]
MSEHREHWQTLLTQLDERTALAEGMGGKDRIARQKERGRMTARERIEHFCDPGSFNE